MRLTSILTNRSKTANARATLLIFSSAWAVNASAQVPRERENVHVRNDCRLAAKTLETGHPAPHSAWALRVIGRCDESAGSALQRLWASPPSDSAALEELYHPSATVRDRRIFEATTAAARALNTSALARITALRVLKAYTDPTVVTTLDYLRPRPTGRGQIMAITDHVVQLEGAEPLPADLKAAVLALLREIAKTDPDSDVRYAAWYLGGRPPG